MSLTLLYRGPLQSCNHDCAYCPFGKRPHTPAELTRDREALQRLVAWIGAGQGAAPRAKRGSLTRSAELSAQNMKPVTRVLFTPWGEGLIHEHYQQAMVQLSRLPHIRRVAIQTNLSGALHWLDACDPRRVGIWATYHPAYQPLSRFVGRCLELHRRGISFSVGMVGLREHLNLLETLRGELPDAVYLWVNAFKDDPDYYRPDELHRLRAVDPLFELNLRSHASLGQTCRTGHDVVAVDGEGTVRRCPFVDEVLGQLYDGELALHPEPRACTAASCRCHIGYVHLVHLGLWERFGEGLLERVLPVQERGRGGTSP